MKEHEEESITTNNDRGFVRIGVVLLITVLLGAFVSYRFARAGDWLPRVPDRIGVWEATDTPIPPTILRMLGDPKALGREYHNPLGETVYVSLVSAGQFENYHDPTVCVPGSGFSMTALKLIPLDKEGKAKARAMVFRRGEQRIVMYYWNQSRDGHTDMEARQSTYRDLLARLRTGFGSVVLGRQTCIVRVYTGVGRIDPLGAQAQRNVEELAQAVHAALKAEGRRPS